MNDYSDEVFTIKARKCLRCGRLLVSEEAIENGYGCRCMQLANAARKAAEPIDGQIDIYDWLGGDKDGRKSDE